jgi:exopolysaccharide production protein ExoQ
MPPPVALTLTLAFIFVLFWADFRRKLGVSWAVWIPCLWFFLLGTRPLSQWLTLGSPTESIDLLEGSPMDRLVFGALIVMALIVVWRRRIAWGRLFLSNPWLILFFGFCVLSVAWSDFPSVSFKRWAKGLGDPLMALVLLSEANAAVALGTVLRRCAFVILPVSILFIKYYPDLGRVYDSWSGLASYTGITTNKNMLGYDLLVLGLFSVCTLITTGIRSTGKSSRLEVGVNLGLLAMVFWLFSTVDAQTAQVALLVSGAVAYLLGIPFVRRHFGFVATVVLVVGVVFQLAFNLSESVITSVGRNTTLTGRTEIWQAALALTVDPWVGAGYESFWLGDRLYTMWDKFPIFHPNQAHNGYLEIYLNLGWIGLGLWMCVLAAAFRNARQKLIPLAAPGQDSVPPNSGPDDLIFARFGLSFLVAYLLCNVTEAGFRSLTVLFVVFQVVAFRCPLRDVASTKTVGAVPKKALIRPRAGVALGPPTPSVGRAGKPGQAGSWSRVNYGESRKEPVAANGRSPIVRTRR